MSRILIACVLILSPWPCAAQTAPPLDQLKQAAALEVESRRKLTQQIVDSLFSYAELGYQEFQSSAYLTALLEKEGFQVTRGVAGMPTAFVATWGSGKPVIGFMADIDGLPETSQKPGVAYHAPLIPNGPGHGEGHNAGQAVNVTAALAVKALMQKHHIPGTIRVYPGIAEELIGSRTYMVNAGLFRDVDVMLSSHVSSTFDTAYGGPVGLALISAEFTFQGKSAHGAGSPWRGRSALDAVELMNIGWNFRREHIRPEHRSHYVISHGGDQPNVVPPLARVWYFFREWDAPKVRELYELGAEIAQGAAMMTGTTMSRRVLAATWPGHFNRPLAETLMANIRAVGMPQWSDEDQQLARAAQRELKVEEKGLALKVGELRGATSAKPQGSGSDDIAEVSWNVPTVVLRYPANIPGMTGHHWSAGIAMATPIAHKGSTVGAKAHAMTAIEILLREELRDAIQRDFAEQTRKTRWESLIPPGTAPPVEMNRERMERFLPALKKLYYDPARYESYMEQLGIRYPTIR